MTPADREAVGVRDRRIDEGLGLPDRGFQVLAPGKPGRNRRGQRTSGPMRILGCNAGRREREHSAVTHKIVDAFAPLPVPALEQHRGTAERE